MPSSDASHRSTLTQPSNRGYLMSVSVAYIAMMDRNFMSRMQLSRHLNRGVVCLLKSLLQNNTVCGHYPRKVGKGERSWGRLLRDADDV